MAQVRQDNVQIKLEIDGSQSKTELDNLTRRAQLLQTGLKEMKRGTDEYIAANKELREVNARMTELRTEIGLTGLTMNQLGKLSSQLNREIKDLVPGTEAFINKSKELTEVDAQLGKVRAEAKGVQDGFDDAGGGILGFIKKAAGFAGVQLGVQALFGSIKQLFSESVDAAVKGSDSISDMEKSLNVTTAEAKALRTQLEGIDTRTSEQNLEGIAVAAGQLGIAKDQAVAFTQSVDQAVVALGDEFTGGVEDVTKSLGGLQKLFKETADVSPADAITKIGSAVNALGADGTATGPVIADFTARIGQLGNLSPQITQTLGLGAAFQELGLTAEISAGGLTNILLTAAKGTADFGKQLGMTTKDFEALINNDPNEVILRLAASLKGASETQIVTTLDKLGIKSQEAVKVISLLADKSDFVRQKQALASAEYEKGTSLLDEFAKKNTNAAAEVEKAEKGFAQYRQELGERLLPIYLRFLQLSGFVVDVLRAVPGFVAENKTAFGLLALAVAFFNAEQIKTQATTLRTLALQKLVALGVLTEVEGKYALVTADEALTAAQEGLNTALAANPIGIIITLLALFAFGLKQLYDRSETFRAAVDSLFGALQPLGAILNAVLAQVGPLVAQLGRFFGSIGGGKAVLEVFGYLMGVAVVAPLKLVVAQVQLSVDAFTGLLDVGKRVANFFGAGFEVDPNGSFDKLAKNLEANGKSILNTLLGQDASAAAEQVNFSMVEVYQGVLGKQQDFLAQGKAQRQAATAEAVAEAAKNDLEALKAREANIRAALALVEAGSAEELRLKKLLITTKRDIDLLGEKKTEGDKKVIRAEALRDLRQLQDEYDKKQADAAAKRAKEQADVEKKIADLRAGLLADETEKKVQQLIAAADKEKATAKGTAEQIAEQRRLIMDKLAVDIEAVRQAQALKQQEEELDIEKRKNALIKNEFDRRAAELLTAAKAEKLKILDTDTQAAEKRRLIEEKLQFDLVQLGKDRAEREREIAERILAIDEDIALRRIARRRQQSSEFSLERARADAEEQAVRKQQLEEQFTQEYFQEGLNDEQKLALARKYLQDKEDLENEYADRSRERDKAGISFGLEQTANALQTVADFQKISSDKELAKIDKDKKARLLKLDQEYKAGTISKETYEAQKASIEQSYDEQTRQIKKRAAEKEKELNVAQAVIQTALSVVKASPNVPLMIAAGLTGAASVAKIIATPIPEFEKGGIVGGPKPTWREKVRQFASGGRINSRAGVADVGQRHSGGGIRMVDGATGEHLGEWERGEAYMILSRDTYANNKHLVDELIDTSLYRGGAPVRRQPGYFEDGGAFATGPAPTTVAGATSSNQELVQAVRRVEDAVRALPSRVKAVIDWNQTDTFALEQELNELADDRNQGAVR
ncbi:phage tail tape measure protein [Hymenobacter cheonanensis]|uniref:phage tail tape measure protein n=1 Tax=Hymenobacter sp. CA2-7 TaxID=3063993 RepID=UPI002712800B|nr:phage tail tape measure protein [Hymenobacter sp. CA2-7]MDO7885380.1 phage tail tape measure protein [Hymenobacter sp. CA2-7]